MHRRHLRRLGRSHLSQAHPGALQHRGRWRPARRAHVVGFARREKTDEAFRTGTRGGRAEVFAPGPERRGLERVSRRASSIIAANSATPRATRRSPSGSTSSTRSAARAATGSSISRVAPSEFEGILEQLAAAGLNQAPRRKLDARDRARSLSAPTCHRAQELNTVVNKRLPRKGHLPHRPLPRQGDRAEHHGAALCQRDLRAALESAATSTTCRSPPREPLGVEAPRAVLRKRRRAARHGAESSAPAPLPRRDGAADRSRRRQRAR